jgi:hypothetical protein
MNQSASVHSIDAIRDFRAALIEFCQEARSAMVDIDLELRRSNEWLHEVQPNYWRNEVRRASEEVNETKKDLHRKRLMTLPGGGTPSCMEERKAVERAQHRQRYAEEKIEITREWARAEQHEATEYEGRATQLATLIDGTIPKAISFLDHTIGHLEAYILAGRPAGGVSSVQTGQATIADNGADSAISPLEQGTAPTPETPAAPPSSQESP